MKQMKEMQIELRKLNKMFKSIERLFWFFAVMLGALMIYCVYLAIENTIRFWPYVDMTPISAETSIMLTVFVAVIWWLFEYGPKVIWE